MAVANTLSFYDTATITDAKSYIVQARVKIFIKFLTNFLRSFVKLIIAF